MTGLALAWFEEEDPRELARWGIAAAVVLGIHVALVAGYTLWPQTEDLDAGEPIAFVELAPLDNTPDAQRLDVAPAPEAMQESKPKEEQKPKDDFEPAPPPELAPTIVPEEVKKPQEKVEEEKPPAPATAAPTRAQRAGRAIEATWRDRLIAHLQRFKRYPSSAESRGEQGVVVLGFSIDRNGRVLAHHVVRSSGYSTLDGEVMEMIERAQPLPAFPASMTQDRLDLTVPIRFSIR
jgi:periplasmic protein TonB